jgi:hypothetical protein
MTNFYQQLANDFDLNALTQIVTALDQRIAIIKQRTPDRAERALHIEALDAMQQSAHSLRRLISVANPRHALKYDCVFKRPHLALAPSLTQAEIEAFANARSYRVDVSTDQIDLYQGRRKIATYMAGE